MSEKYVFKKKNKYPLNAKCKSKNFVYFRYRDELYFGYVYDAMEDKDGHIIYTIQLGS